METSLQPVSCRETSFPRKEKMICFSVGSVDSVWTYSTSVQVFWSPPLKKTQFLIRLWALLTLVFLHCYTYCVLHFHTTEKHCMFHSSRTSLQLPLSFKDNWECTYGDSVSSLSSHECIQSGPHTLLSFLFKSSLTWLISITADFLTSLTSSRVLKMDLQLMTEAKRESSTWAFSCPL